MKQITGLVALILLFALTATAQVLDNGKVQQGNTYIFSNHTYPDTLLYNTSYIIQELAIGNELKQSEAEFRLLYETFVKTRPHPTGKQLILGVLLKEITGQTTYKDFNVRELLFPDGLRFDLSHIKNNRIIDKSMHIQPELVRFDTNWIFLQSDYTGFTERLKIGDVKFYFDEPGKQRLLKRFSLINDYYAGIQIIDSIRVEAGKISFGSKDDIGKSIIFLFEIDKIREKLGRKEFFDVLPLDYKDPGGLLQKIRALDLMRNRIKTLTEEVLDSSSAMTKPEIEQAFDFYISLQAKYMQWAATAGHKFQQWFHQLLIKQYQQDDIDFYDTYLKKTKTENLRGVAYKTFFAKNQEFIDSCINQQLYTDALAILRNISNLSPLVPQYVDEDYTRKQQSRAMHGLFRSYIRVAERAISVRNFELANDYLMRAGDFQKENNNFIISDIEVRKTAQKLVDAYIHSATGEIGAGDYKAALEMLATARRKSEIHGLDAHEHKLDSLMRMAREGIFQYYLTMASRSFNNGNYAMARAYLDEAENYNYTDKETAKDFEPIGDLPEYETYLEEAREEISGSNYEKALMILEYDAKRTAPAENIWERDSLAKTAALELAARLISKTENLVFNNDDGKARDAVEKAESLIIEYNLENEQLMEHLNYAQSALNDLNCRNALDKYNDLLTRGLNAADESMYIEALAWFREAAGQQEILLDCAYSDEVAIDAMSKYAPAANYQQKLKLLKKTLYDHGFPEAISQYLELENFYDRHDLQGLKLNHPGLEDFLMAQDNPALIKASFEHFYTRGYCQKSLQMLFLLQKSGYPEPKAAKAQRRLASLCFKQHGPDAAFYPLKENKWFSAFRKKLFFLNLFDTVNVFFKGKHEEKPAQ